MNPGNGMGGRIRTDYEAVLSAASRPDRRRLMGWLVEGPLTADGAVLPWVNPAHSGDARPAVAGLLLALLAQDIDDGPRMPKDRAASQLARCRRILEAQLADLGDRGMVGDDGVDDLFDSGIVLHGLLRLYERMVEAIDDGALRLLGAAIERVYAGVLNGIANQRVSSGSPGEPHWRQVWGSHHLRLALPLAAYDRTFATAGEVRPAAAIRRLLRDLMPQAEDGRCVVHRGGERIYVPACCYAAEGLLAVEPTVDAGARPQAVATATWLATIQQGDGSMLAWHDGERAFGPRRSDIVGQSVRLWAAVDRHRFARSIARGLEHLASLQSPCGGLRYGPESDDISTRSTIFAAQAIAWAEGDRRARWLV